MPIGFMVTLKGCFITPLNIVWQEKYVTYSTIYVNIDNTFDDMKLQNNHPKIQWTIVVKLSNNLLIAWSAYYIIILKSYL